MDLIRVLIADDHAIVREGLRTLITSDPTLQLVGEAAGGIEAVSQASQLKPDVILMDLVMPDMGGIEAIREIKSERAGGADPGPHQLFRRKPGFPGDQSRRGGILAQRFTSPPAAAGHPRCLPR